MFTGIDHVELVPSDFEKSLNFYVEVLGFQLKSRRKSERPPMEENAFIELNGSLIELFSVKGPALASTEAWQIGCRSFGLGVEDADRAIEYLKTRGVEIATEPRTVGTSKVAAIKDPDGLTIELVQRDEDSWAAR
jgi:glyoxylase I family protein